MNGSRTHDLKNLKVKKGQIEVKKMASTLNINSELENRIYGVIYGNACGDAIGLLTEFMSKREAKVYYGNKKELEYEMKVPDFHRERWKTGDWTDDTDQMILIILSIIDQQGEVSKTDYAAKLQNWSLKGFSELGDFAGMGIGATTKKVLHRENYLTDPHQASLNVWEELGRQAAPNGALMRTSILGVFQYQSLEKVIQNTVSICKVTHADPRCVASCVALTTAIALMLQRPVDLVKTNGEFKVELIIDRSYAEACRMLPDEKSQRDELRKYMYAKKLTPLELDDQRKMGYTYKCLGAAFWAFKQTDFRKALQKICMKGGDADTNGAAAGALLGCKLGFRSIPESWRQKLCHKSWLDGHIQSFLPLINLNQNEAIEK
ncbi:ADP-ribosylarginine hydrolase Tri1-like isoform X2 [Clytia hemisphaerica]|uniref:ADP-ribosylglycohydrolase n=1 Tax=Clytia hemisphaerica TaxID=252671 RepID=A0A7M5WJ92_9CNID